jgi:hypothetical protein
LDSNSVFNGASFMAELFLDQGDAIAPRSTGAVNLEDDVMPRAAASPIFTAESGLTRYLEEIRRLPMLEPHEEFMLAKRWREQGDREAAHRLVTSHLRLVAKIAMGYRGYGLPIAEVLSEGNLGLMKAVGRFEPEKGFRLATYAMWAGINSGIRTSLVVARENGNHREPEKAVLQPAQGEERDFRLRGRGPAPRPGQADCRTYRRNRAGCHPNESPTWR